MISEVLKRDLNRRAACRARVNEGVVEDGGLRLTPVDWGPLLVMYCTPCNTQ